MRILITLSTFFLCLAFSSSVQAQTTYTTVKGYAACVSKKYINDMITYSTQKDYDAIQALLDAGVCLEITNEIEVYLVESTWGLVEIRPKGMTDTIWTVSEAIKRN